MSEQLELNKASFQKEVLQAAHANPSGDILTMVENTRRNTLKLLAVPLKSRIGYDILHLQALAQLSSQGMFGVQQHNVLNNLTMEDEDELFTERLKHWFHETNRLLVAMESLRRTDIGVFKEILNNI